MEHFKKYEKAAVWEASNGQLKLSPNLKVSKLAGKVMLFKLWLKSWKPPDLKKHVEASRPKKKEKTRNDWEMKVNSWNI